MKGYIWKSIFSKLCQEFIAVQHSAGMRFITQERTLQHFDHFCYYNGHEGTRITKEMLDEFIYVKTQARSSWRHKEVVLRNFTIYLDKLGYKPYIPEIKTQLPRCNYIPHIYTKEERRRFFQAIDEYPLASQSSRNDVDPILFRFLYSTGARLSEALNLTIKDFNEEQGYVRILHSKNQKSRLLPLHTSMTTKISKFIKSYHKNHGNDCYLFPSSLQTRMDSSTAYRHFRDYLFMADIPHTNTGPRIHDWRHGMAVENLRRWSSSGQELMNLIPYLSAYMGHSDFRATQYYLRLTAEIYPEMMEVLEQACLEIIPEGEYTDEKN